MNRSYRTAAGPALAPDTFPKAILYFAAALIAISLLSVGLVRLTGNGPDQLAARAVAQRDLIFKDGSDGGVRVVDGKTGTTLTVLPGEQGFVRGALRALARERFARGIGSDQPFELIARADGRLTLNDPSTNKRVDLESFGPQNAGEFRRFLDMAPMH